MQLLLDPFLSLVYRSFASYSLPISSLLSSSNIESDIILLTHGALSVSLLTSFDLSYFLRQLVPDITALYFFLGDKALSISGIFVKVDAKRFRCRLNLADVHTHSSRTNTARIYPAFRLLFFSKNVQASEFSTPER